MDIFKDPNADRTSRQKVTNVAGALVAIIALFVDLDKIGVSSEQLLSALAIAIILAQYFMREAMKRLPAPPPADAAPAPGPLEEGEADASR